MKVKFLVIILLSIVTNVFSQSISNSPFDIKVDGIQLDIGDTRITSINSQYKTATILFKGIDRWYRLTMVADSTDGLIEIIEPKSGLLISCDEIYWKEGYGKTRFVVFALNAFKTYSFTY